jgi:D-alanyl-D-alanine carboxypeptidase
MATTTADANTRHRRHHVERSSSSNDDSSARGIESSGRYADFVVDAKTGRVLHAVNADAPRHPASLTKMMTLYIMFEELERGRFTMDSPLTVSKHASLQSPTKLDLRPGQTISVSDAIHGLVTQSANDAAVTIAENIGGSEEAFAKRMTQTAHRIGMSNSYFYNASGLPNADQYTTARDMVTLGRALQERFPENYKVFSTRSFAYQGRVYGNHNHLLGRLDGIDGIKTGYTEASGFNLVTSIHRDGHFLVAAVLGGSSSGARDAQMVRLVEASLPQSSTGPHTASVFTDVHMAARDGDEKPSAPIAVAAIHADPAPVATVSQGKSSDAPGAPVVLAPKVDIIAVKPMRPRLADHAAVADRSGTKFDDHAASLIMAKAILADQKQHKQVVASLDDFIPSAPSAKPGSATVADPRSAPEKTAVGRGRQDDRAQAEADRDRTERLMTASVEPMDDKPHVSDPAKSHTAGMPAPIREGWLIQIAAVDNVNDAKMILTRAKGAASDKLASSTPVTEPFSKGNTTMYRARFEGFSNQKAANAACSSLKRKDFACLVIHQ